MQNAANIKKAVIVLLFLFLALMSAHTGGFLFDMNWFRDWALHIFKNGLGNAYTTWNNYMPVYQYVLWLYGKVVGSEKEIAHLILHLKNVTLVFEFVGLWYVYKWIDKKVDFMLLLVFSMLNISYAYNTVVWGQIDAIHSAMVFVAMYYAYNRKMALSAIWYVFAINAKLQAIVFMPVLGLVYLYNIAESRSIKQVVLTLVALAGCQLLILLPFISIDGGWDLFWNMVNSATSTYPTVTAGSHNFWHLILKNPGDVADSTVFVAGLTYKQVGLGLFFASSFVALLPLLKSVYGKMLNKAGSEMISKEKLWLSCALVAILFFYFCTQMHERYCHPAFIFLTAYAFYTGRFLPYILFSVAYFFNLERYMKWLWLEGGYSSDLFGGIFGAIVYGVVIICLFVKLYGKDYKQNAAALTLTSA